jgi:pyrroloquinoline quinone (PQQ) biosynthesis protein C
MSSLDEANEFSAKVRERQKKEGVWLADCLFVDRVATGKAAKSEIGEWARQFFVAIEHLHRIAHARPKVRLEGLPPDIKKHFWENRVEEQYGALSNTAGHLELLIQLGEAAGVSRLDMVTSKPNAQTRKVMDWAQEHVPQADEFLTAQVVVGMLEAMNPAASTKLAEGCQKHYGMTDMQVRFFTVHIVADAEHGEVANRILSLVPKDRWAMIEDQALLQSHLFHDMWCGVCPPNSKAA